jgi:hypothetical protein
MSLRQGFNLFSDKLFLAKSMGASLKPLVLLVAAVMLASGLLMVESAFAQSTPKPFAPEFTAKYTDYSYDIPTTTSTSTDPFTGKQIITTNNGYHVDNRTVILVIKNQQINTVDQANPLSLYYYVRFKGHYENNESDWMYLPKELKYGYGPASNSSESVWYYTLNSLASQYYLYFSDNSEIDFQVQAFIGNQTLSTVGLGGHYVFTGEGSNWSKTQTVTIKNSNSQTPSVPEFSVMTILPLFVITLLAIALLKPKIQKLFYN